MLPLPTVPAGLAEVLQACRGAFGAPAFATFTALVTGVLGGTGRRTVTGMWVAAGLAGRVHWSRAHRFFSHARWHADTLGLLLARAVITAFVPQGAALTVAVDDTLFHRFGKNVFGAAWQHDSSAKGRTGSVAGTASSSPDSWSRYRSCTVEVFLPVLFPSAHRRTRRRSRTRTRRSPRPKRPARC